MQIAKKHAVSVSSVSVKSSIVHFPLTQFDVQTEWCIKFQKSAVAHLQRLYPGQKTERVFMNWTWWVLAGLPFPHLVRVMDCFFHEGIKVFYRISLAILILYQKHVPNASTSTAAVSDGATNTAATSSTASSTTTTIAKTNDNMKLNNLKIGANWKANDDKPNDIEMALPMFCRKLPVSPGKLLRTAFNIRALRFVSCIRNASPFRSSPPKHNCCWLFPYESCLLVLYLAAQRIFQGCSSRLKWCWEVKLFLAAQKV